MILVLLAVSLFIFFCAVNSRHSRIILPSIVDTTIMLLIPILITVGLFVPFGFEEPELVDSKQLYPVNYAFRETQAERDYYLVVQNGSKNNTYYYCTKSDTMSILSGNDEGYALEKVYDDVRVVVKDVSEPVIETYRREAIRTPFNFALFAGRTEYVIKVPEEFIKNNFN
jgi:hypothetical protein